MGKPGEITLDRKRAFLLAWQIFRMATGTKRVGITIREGEVEIVGDKLIKEGVNG